MRLRLLVIDDLEDDFKLVCAALELAGIAVDGCRVDEAYDLECVLEERDWDLCLLDWVMPTLTTPEAIRAIKQSRQPTLPFVVWSGRDDTKVAFIATEVLGALEFMAKHLMIERLPQIVGTLLASD